MKTFIAAVSIVFGLLSCDNRENYFKGNNAAPVLILKKDDAKASGDSAKFSLKVKQESITLNFTAKDESNNLAHVSIHRASGDSADPDKNTFSGDAISDKVTFAIKKAGVSVFVFSAVDKLGESTSVQYTLTVFENLPPVAKLAATPSQDNKYLYTLDTNGSKDGDQKFGGNIQLYQYTIDGYSFNKTSPRILHTFLSTGRHTIKLVAVDNEGMPSEALNLDVNIPQ